MCGNLLRQCCGLRQSHNLSLLICAVRHQRCVIWWRLAIKNQISDEFSTRAWIWRKKIYSFCCSFCKMLCWRCCCHAGSDNVSNTLIISRAIKISNRVNPFCINVPFFDRTLIRRIKKRNAQGEFSRSGSQNIKICKRNKLEGIRNYNIKILKLIN